MDNLTLVFDPTPRPVSSYAELWGRDPRTLNAWCAKGWVPGAYKHPSGEWWVSPLEMIGFNPAGVETAHIQRPRKGVPKHPARMIYPGDR